MHRRVVALLAALSSTAFATDYHVGPGQPLASIGAVPWESLLAGDTVFIHARPTPYAEKWVLNRVGTAQAPVTVRGVPDANGALPVILGEGATTRGQLNAWNEERGIIKVGGSNSPPDGTPAWVVIEGLHLRRARGAFTGRNGASSYATNAAAIYVEKGDHVTVRGCELEDSGNGLFVASASTDVTVEGNFIHGNGNPGSIYEHNTYTEARGIVYQGNRFGALCAGCGGNNLKDRSSGTVIRYNWIEGGNRQLDLVDSAALSADPAYATTFVYGNVLLEHDGDGNSQLVHFGGDSGTLGDYRGTLYLWNNTVISERVTNTTLVRLSSAGQTADVRNNLLYVSAAGSKLAWLDGAGTVLHGGNWLKPGAAASFSGGAGPVTLVGADVLAASPGFVAEGAQDYRLTATSSARDAAAALTSATTAYPLTRQYLRHQQTELRPVDGALDIGAFEFSSGAPPDAGSAPDGGHAVDAGDPEDAGAPLDAGHAPEGDGGVTGPGQPASGCGCSAGSAVELGGVLASVLAVAARRRR